MSRKKLKRQSKPPRRMLKTVNPLRPLKRHQSNPRRKLPLLRRKPPRLPKLLRRLSLKLMNQSSQKWTQRLKKLSPKRLSKKKRARK